MNNPQIIEVNGQQYEQINHTQQKRSKTVNKFLMMSAMFGGFDTATGYSRSLPAGINIVEEYALIQQKNQSFQELTSILW